MKYDLAINELKNSLDTVKINLPINEREGNKGQAALEKRVAASIESALDILKPKVYKTKKDWATDHKARAKHPRA